MNKNASSSEEISFEFIKGDTAIVIPALLNGTHNVNLIFDTGAGLEVISKKLANELNIRAEQQFTGKRLTNEPLTIKVGNLNSLKVGTFKAENLEVAPFDFFDEMAKNQNIHGLLSLKAFQNKAVTIDYPRSMMILESKESLAKRRKTGIAIPIYFEKQIPPSLGIHLDLLIDDKWTQRAIVDTGSASTKLHLKYFEKMLLNPNSEDINRKSYTTIAGFKTESLLTPTPGRISLKEAPNIKVQKSPTRFDPNLRLGSIGGNFFLDKIITFDLKNKLLIINH